MRRFFEWEWLGIEFDSFCRPSILSLPSPAFYEAFYQILCERCHTWTDLDPDFRAEKRAIAEFIFGRVESQDIILSIGCGLGYVEHCLLELSQGTLHLEVTEVAPAALKLIQKEIPASRVHVGFFPECIPTNLKYNLTIMSDIDYTMDQSSLAVLLHQVKGRLAPGGRCLLISGVFDSPVSFGWKILRAAKKTAVAALGAVGLFHRRQFWGWVRQKEDYQDAFSQAGYSELRDGFIDIGPNPVGYYWIEARPS